MHSTTNTNELWVSTIDDETLSFINKKSCQNPLCLSSVSYILDPEMVIKSTRNDLFLSQELICLNNRKIKKEDFLITRFGKFIVYTKMNNCGKCFVSMNYAISDKRCEFCNDTILGYLISSKTNIGSLILYSDLVYRHFEMCRKLYISTHLYL